MESYRSELACQPWLRGLAIAPSAAKTQWRREALATQGAYRFGGSPPICDRLTSSADPPGPQAGIPRQHEAQSACDLGLVGHAPYFSGILSVFSLQPAPDACLVPRVLLTEARFEIALLARYDDERHH
jgi:hypothetical protein